MVVLKNRAVVVEDGLEGLVCERERGEEEKRRGREGGRERERERERERQRLKSQVHTKLKII